MTGPRPEITDREHQVQLSAADRARVAAWADTGLGALIVGRRVTFESVAGGGMLVRTLPPGDWSEDMRVARALEIARDWVYDGDHQKMWVIDQMVRTLTGCPIVARPVPGSATGETYEAQGESDAYRRFVAEVGDWDEGIAP
jgi:hypothetical protein